MKLALLACLLSSAAVTPSAPVTTVTREAVQTTTDTSGASPVTKASQSLGAAASTRNLVIGITC